MGYEIQPAVVRCVCDWCGCKGEHTTEPGVAGRFLPDGWDTTAKFARSYAPYDNVKTEVICPDCNEAACSSVSNVRHAIQQLALNKSA